MNYCEVKRGNCGHAAPVPAKCGPHRQGGGAGVGAGDRHQEAPQSRGCAVQRQHGRWMDGYIIRCLVDIMFQWLHLGIVMADVGPQTETGRYYVAR